MNKYTFLKKSHIKFTAVLMVLSFTLTSIPCMDEAMALSPWAGMQSVEIRRALIERALETDRLEYADLDDPMLMDRDSVLLPHGKILLSKALENDTLRKLRTVFHQEIEAVMQIVEMQNRSRYSSMMNMVLSNEAIVQAHLEAFLDGTRPAVPDEMLFNDIIARAFELILLSENGAISPREMTAREKEFIRVIRPVIMASRHSYFTGIFWDHGVRKTSLRLAVANGIHFRQTAIKRHSYASAELPEKPEEKPHQEKSVTDSLINAALRSRADWKGLGACREHALALVRILTTEGIEASVYFGDYHYWVETADHVIDAFPEGNDLECVRASEIAGTPGVLCVERSSSLAGKFYSGKKEKHLTAKTRAEANDEAGYRGQIIRRLERIEATKLRNLSLRKNLADDDPFAMETKISLKAARERLRTEREKLKKAERAGTKAEDVPGMFSPAASYRDYGPGHSDISEAQAGTLRKDRLFSGLAEKISASNLPKYLPLVLIGAGAAILSWASREMLADAFIFPAAFTGAVLSPASDPDLKKEREDQLKATARKRSAELQRSGYQTMAIFSREKAEKKDVYGQVVERNYKHVYEAIDMVTGLAREQGLKTAEIQKLQALTHELVYNILDFGVCGAIGVKPVIARGIIPAIEIVGWDHGPGIQDPEKERLRSEKRVASGEGFGFYRFSHDADSLVVESKGNIWKSGAWGDLEKKGISLVMSGARITLTVHERDVRGNTVYDTASEQEKKTAPRTRAGFSFGLSGSRGSGGISVIIRTLIAGGIFLTGILGIYRMMVKISDRSLENHRTFNKVLDGLDLARPQVFADEKAMMLWLSEIPREVEFSLEANISEDGSHTVYFLAVGDENSVSFPKKPRIAIHSHPAGDNILDQMPSIQDIVSALDGHIDIIVLAKGRVVKLTRQPDSPLTPFGMILSELDTKVREFMRAKGIRGSEVRNLLVEEVLDRVIFEKMSDWPVFDLGWGEPKASFYNPNAWGYMIRLFGFELTEFRDGEYLDIWEKDTDTLMRIEEIEKQGDRFYEEFKIRSDEIISDKFESVFGSAYRRGGKATVVALTMLAGTAIAAAALPWIMRFFDAGSLTAFSLLTVFFGGMTLAPVSSSGPDVISKKTGQLEGMKNYQKVFLEFLGFEMNGPVRKIAPGFGAAFSPITGSNKPYIERLLGDASHNKNVILLIDLETEDPIAIIYQDARSSDLPVHAVFMHSGDLIHRQDRDEEFSAVYEIFNKIHGRKKPWKNPYGRLLEFLGFTPHALHTFENSNGITIFPSVYNEDDSFGLYFNSLKVAARNKKRVLIIGSGTGIEIKTLLSAGGIEEIVVTESDALAMANTKFTVSSLTAGNESQPRISFSMSDTLAGLGKFDLIAFACPLALTDSVKKEADTAKIDLILDNTFVHGVTFDPDGKTTFGAIEQAARHLNPGGRLLLINHDAPEIDEYLEKSGFIFEKESLGLSNIQMPIVIYSAGIPFADRAEDRAELPVGDNLDDIEKAPATLQAPGKPATEEHFISCLSLLRQKVSSFYDLAWQKLEKALFAGERERQSVILYADDILRSAAVIDIERTMSKITSDHGVLNGGKIILFARIAENAVILENLIKKSTPGAETVIITFNDLEKRRNLRGNETGEVTSLVREARRKGAAEILAIIKGPSLDIKADTPEDLVELSKRLKIPVIIMGSENAVYSFASAIEQALLVKKVTGRDGWVVSLLPIRTISEDIRIFHQEYLGALNAHIAA